MTGFTTPFLKSFSIQIRVINALLRREVLTRYGRDNIGFLWLFVEPMIFIVGMTALFAYRGLFISGIPVIPFLITGYSSVLMWRNAANRCSKAILPNISLLYHRNVTVLDLFLARIVLEIAGASMALIVISSLLIAMGYMALPADILSMVEGWFLLAFFATGLGLIVGALTEMSDGFERIWQIITLVSFPVSGAFFMVEWLPQSAQEMALWVPMIHGVELMREGYYGAMVKAHYSVTYLVVVNFIMLLVGLALVYKAKDNVGSE